MNNANPGVDAFFSNAKKWREEMEILRRIVLDCPLTEELKWKQPCYTFQNNNVVIISGFKDYCLLNFIKGALLKDENIMTAGQYAMMAGRDNLYGQDALSGLMEWTQMSNSFLLDLQQSSNTFIQ